MSEPDQTILGPTGDPEAFDVGATYVPKQSAPAQLDIEVNEGYGVTIVPSTEAASQTDQTYVPDHVELGSATIVDHSAVDDPNANTIIPDFQLADEDSADIPLQKGKKSVPPPTSAKRTVAGDSALNGGSGSGEELISEAQTVQRPADQAAGLPRREDRGRFASTLSRQIWRSQEKQDFNELITIRRGPVSGNLPFSLKPDADFEVIQKLAEGGMGVVYIARQKSLNRELAIKTLKHQANPDGTMPAQESGARHRTRANQQRRDMFMSEALVTANLVHPNIIPIHDLAETDDGMLYYAMKRVHGVPWNQTLRTMTLQENLDVLEKVCDAIAYAHHHGVINRDLKPENIMLGEYGEVLVLDWGLAVPAPHAADPNFRSPVASFGAGTPAYMSPELWTGPADRIGEWSDIYLLGAILFEIITGLPPHQFPDANARRSSGDFWKSLDEVLRLNQIRQVPIKDELLEIALKAMQTDPDQRHGSVLEFQFAIRSFQRHEESRRLSRRADELISAVSESGADYSVYQTAAALHEEALRIWPNNSPSRKELRDVRLQYARIARERGDFDLAIQVAALEEGPEFSDLTKRLKNAKVMRSAAKWTALVAMTAVVLLGAKSIYDNGIIVDLNSEVAARQLEAQEAVNKARQAEADAEAATTKANEATAVAAKAMTDAQKAEEDAGRAKSEAETARTEAQKSRDEATAAFAEAAKAAMEADLSKQAAATAMTQAEAAEQRRIEAQNQQAAAETAARVAEVEIQFQSIRGLALDENYTDAVRAIDRLLEGQLLQNLPEAMRLERTTELQIQKQQLQKRTLQSESPVQSQAVSPDYRLIAQGDSSGRIIVRTNPAIEGEWPNQQEFEVRLTAPITALTFPHPGFLLAASEHQVLRIDLSTQQSSVVQEHPGQVTSMDVLDNRLMSGDQKGNVVVSDLNSGAQLGQLQIASEIRDVKFVPGTEIFITAASRGDESADVIAWQLVAAEDQKYSIERLGQLRFSRDEVVPPQKLSLSPDGTVLVLSNSRNGKLLTLTRSTQETTPADDTNDQNNRTSSSTGQLRRQGGFPFQPVEDHQTSDSESRQSHQRPVNDLVWSKDGKSLVSASDDRSVIVWKWNGTKLVFDKRLKGHGGRVSQATFLDERARYVGSSSSDLSSRLWDLDSFDADRREIRDSLRLSQNHFRHTTARSHYILCSLQAEESEIECTTLNRSPVFHRGAVEDVDFSRDGETLITAASDGTVALWKVADGTMQQRGTVQELFTEGHRFNISRNRILHSSSTEDHDLLVTSGFDGTLRLWELSDRRNQGLQRAIIENVGLVHAFDVAHNGSFLIASGYDAGPLQYHCRIFQTNELLTAGSGITEPQGVLSGLHKSDVTAIAVSPDDQLIATAGRDGTIGIWSATAQRLVAVCRGHRSNTIISQLIWSSNHEFYSAGFDGQLLQWTVAASAQPEAASVDGQQSPPVVISNPIRMKTRQLPIEHLSLSPRGDGLLLVSIEDRDSADKDINATVFQSHIDRIDPAAPQTLIPVRLPQTSDAGSQLIYSIDWHPDGERILVSTGRHIHFVDANSWTTRRVIAASGFREVSARFASTRAGAEAIGTENTNDWVILSDGPTASLWDLRLNRRLATFDGPSMIRSVAISKDPQHSIAVTAGVHTRVFSSNQDDTKFGTILQRLQTDASVLTTAAEFSSTRTNVCAIGSESGRVELLRFEGDEVIRELVASQSAPIADLAFEPTSDLLFSIAVTGELLISRPQHGDNPPQHQTIPAATLLPLLRQTQPFKFLCCRPAPDGKHLFLGGLERNSELSLGWILEYSFDADLNPNLRFVCEVRGHSAGGIQTAEFLPESPWIVTGGTDGALIVWNWVHPIAGEVPSAYEAFRLTEQNSTFAHGAAITALRATTTGIIASSSADRTTKIWRLKRPSL